MITVKGCSVFSGRNIEIRFVNSAIAMVKELQTTEKLPYIAPGFIDTQVNGYRGLITVPESLKRKIS